MLQDSAITERTESKITVFNSNVTVPVHLATAVVASWLCHNQPHGVSSDLHRVESVDTNRRCDVTVAAANDVCHWPQPQSSDASSCVTCVLLVQVSTTWALACLEVVQQCPRLARQVKARLLDGIGSHWIEQCFTSPPTQYRPMGDGFYRAKDSSNRIKVLKEQIVGYTDKSNIQ